MVHFFCQKVSNFFEKIPTFLGQLETSNFNRNFACILLYLVPELFFEKNGFLEKFSFFSRGRIFYLILSMKSVALEKVFTTLFYLVVGLFLRRYRETGKSNQLRTNLAGQRRVSIQKSQNRKNYDNNYKRKNFRKSFPKKSRFSFLATGRPVKWPVAGHWPASWFFRFLKKLNFKKYDCKTHKSTLLNL